jgi:hypothetical protein
MAARMRLPFAGGQDRPQETRIAEAIVARLSLLHRDAGLFLAHVGEAPVMPSRISDRESWDALLREMNTRTPAALVVIDGARTGAGEMSIEREHWERTYDVTIAVFSNHRRDLVLGRLNPDAVSEAESGKDPGLRAACELIDNLLLGFPLDLDDVGDLEPGRQGMQTVYAGALGTLREMHYTVEAEMTRTAWPDVGRYLESVRTSLASLTESAGLTLDLETEVS